MGVKIQEERRRGAPATMGPGHAVVSGRVNFPSSHGLQAESAGRQTRSKGRPTSDARSPSEATQPDLLAVFVGSHYQAGAEVTCHVYLEISCALRAASSCHCDRGLRWWVE